MGHRSDLGQRIAFGCQALNLQFADLAEKAKMTRQYLNNLTSGRITKSKYLDAVAKVLGCRVEWLVFGTGKAPTWADEPRPPPEPGQHTPLELSLQEENRLLRSELARFRHENQHLRDQIEAVRRKGRIATVLARLEELEVSVAQLEGRKATAPVSDPGTAVAS